MDVAAVTLLFGDSFRCGRALAEREQAIRAADPNVERIARFADEVDVAAFDMEVQSAPLFALGRHFVVRNVDKARKPKPWVDLAGRSLPSATYVTFLSTPDAKSSHPFVKACAERGVLVSLPGLPAKSLVQAARSILGESGLRASPQVLESLLERTNGDLVALASEARKLRAFAGNTDVAPDMVESLVFPGAETTVYPFYDRLGERDLRASLQALDDLRDDAGRILAGAVRHLARLTALRALLDKRVPQVTAGELLGLPDWLLRRLTAQAKRSRLDEAAAALALGVRLDTEVKSGALLAQDALLELVFSVTFAAAASVPG